MATDTTEVSSGPKVNPFAGWAPYDERLRRWRQTPDNRVPDESGGTDLIHETGIATVYPASPEFPNLFHAHVGDPDAKTDPKWDSPSGVVYSWRWTIGRTGAAFYGTVVRKRPTFVTWDLVPAILRVAGDLRTPDELFDFGVISSDAYKIAQALEGCGDPLVTGDIRKAADFPTGKDHSSRYHKALAELETRLLITTEFPEGEVEGEGGGKRHALTFERRRDHIESALKLSADEAIAVILSRYLWSAMFVQPVVFARHLGVDRHIVDGVVDQLVESGALVRTQVDGVKADVFVGNE